jgi:hypothetical protein
MPDSLEIGIVNNPDTLLNNDLESVLSECEGEERIRNPTMYFQKLADLEAEVYYRSGVRVYGTDARQRLGQCTKEFKPCYSNLLAGGVVPAPPSKMQGHFSP